MGLLVGVMTSYGQVKPQLVQIARIPEGVELTVYGSLLNVEVIEIEKTGGGLRNKIFSLNPLKIERIFISSLNMEGVKWKDTVVLPGATYKYRVRYCTQERKGQWSETLMF